MGAWARAPRGARRRSRPPSSARAPTPPTRTSPGPPSIARQARCPRLAGQTRRCSITPGSEQIRATIERDGLLADLEAIGGTVLANACGPCIGQWDRHRSRPDGTVNTIVTSYNRNFPKRNDGSANTKAFVASPDMVVAYALAGTLDFNPLTDTIRAADGTEVRLDTPSGEDLPRSRLRAGVEPGSSARSDGARSGRGRRWHPRPSGCSCWPRSRPGTARTTSSLPVLLKAKGKCTTDHISAAGPLAHVPRSPREHLRQSVPRGRATPSPVPPDEGKDPLDGVTRPFPEIAKHLARRVVRWCAVGDENYGEGSSREHAAMEPRYRGGLVVLARSFARIHETNLKKQGILPLTFADPSDLRRDRRGRPDQRLRSWPHWRPEQPVRCR